MHRPFIINIIFFICILFQETNAVKARTYCTFFKFNCLKLFIFFHSHWYCWHCSNGIPTWFKSFYVSPDILWFRCISLHTNSTTSRLWCFICRRILSIIIDNMFTWWTMLCWSVLMSSMDNNRWTKMYKKMFIIQNLDYYDSIYQKIFTSFSTSFFVLLFRKMPKLLRSVRYVSLYNRFLFLFQILLQFIPFKRIFFINIRILPIQSKPTKKMNHIVDSFTFYQQDLTV